ncbi:hypothetical protein [Micromonospora sp. NPDC048843]|uniref:hypothetical protein n=1 Tax=Micromonospora sp. NPDC048843 TaxID=3155389 RepID=UPI0033CD9107
MNDAETVAYGGVVRSVLGCRAYALLGRSAGRRTPPPTTEVALSAVLSALTSGFRPP